MAGGDPSLLGAWPLDDPFHVPPCSTVRLSGLLILEVDHTMCSASDFANGAVFIGSVVVDNLDHVILPDGIASVVLHVVVEVCLLPLSLLYVDEQVTFSVV